MRAENMLYNNRTQCYGKVYFPELLTLFPVSHLAFNAVQFHCTHHSISLNNTMKNVQKMQWGRVEPASSHPRPLIYLVIYEIYEKNFINIDQCAMIHEQGLHRSNVCRVEKQIKFNGIVFVQYANAMNLIFQLKNERGKRKKDENSE